MYIVFGLCHVCIAQNVIVSSDVYQSRWNTQTQTPFEVRYFLRSSDIGNVSRDPSWRFANDLPKLIQRATHDDYIKSGYDRGHLCPAQDRSNDPYRMRETFRISNIAPQVPSLNRGAWKRTEIAERHLARFMNQVRVITMPLYLEKDTAFIGVNKIAVPHAFLKIIYDVNPDTIYNIYFLWNK